MLIKPFKQLIEEYHRKKETQEYSGFVEDNNDPKKLGRIKVRTELYEDVDFDALPWCYPTPNFFLGNSKNAVCFSVPEIGSQVKVYYPTHDKTAPFYKGMEFNEKNKCTFFDIDYPNTYGFKDSRGNFIIINKATDITQYQHSSGTNIKIESDGTYTITTPDGSYIYSDCNGNMRICGNTLTINMNDSININANTINLTGTDSNINSTSTGVYINSNIISEVAIGVHTISGSTNNIYSSSNINARCNNGGGTFNIIGYETVSKDVVVTGNETVNGSSGISVPNGDVKASGVSLVNHTHPFNYNAGDNPSQGTTDKP